MRGRTVSKQSHTHTRLPGPGDFWHQEPEWQGERRQPRPIAEREPRENGEQTFACLVWNPATQRAEPGRFKAHAADYLYDPMRGDL